MRAHAERELAAAGAESVEWTIGAEMRYLGQGAEVPVSIPFEHASVVTGRKLVAAFEEQYQKLYGRLVPNAEIQVITWRLVGRAPTIGRHFEWADGRVRPKAEKVDSRRIYLPLKRGFSEVSVYDRYSLPAGACLQAPLILEERESTIVVAVAAEVTIRPDLTVSILIKEFD
jgi:N-methylhydantoinase A